MKKLSTIILSTLIVATLLYSSEINKGSFLGLKFGSDLKTYSKLLKPLPSEYDARMSCEKYEIIGKICTIDNELNYETKHRVIQDKRIKSILLYFNDKNKLFYIKVLTPVLYYFAKYKQAGDATFNKYYKFLKSLPVKNAKKCYIWKPDTLIMGKSYDHTTYQLTKSVSNKKMQDEFDKKVKLAKQKAKKLDKKKIENLKVSF